MSQASVSLVSRSRPTRIARVLHRSPAALLSAFAVVAFAMDYEKRSGVAFLLATAVIKRVPVEGCPVHGIGNVAGISALQRHGYVRLSGVAAKQIISLTAMGAAVSDRHDDWVRAVETDWRHSLGAPRVRALRRALENVADKARVTRSSQPG